MQRLQIQKMEYIRYKSKEKLLARRVAINPIWYIVALLLFIKSGRIGNIVSSFLSLDFSMYLVCDATNLELKSKIVI